MIARMMRDEKNWLTCRMCVFAGCVNVVSVVLWWLFVFAAGTVSVSMLANSDTSVPELRVPTIILSAVWQLDALYVTVWCGGFVAQLSTWERCGCVAGAGGRREDLSVAPVWPSAPVTTRGTGSLQAMQGS